MANPKSEVRSLKSKVFIGLGSNVGDRTRFLVNAVSELRKLDRRLKTSSVHETEPIGPSKRKFLNQVIELRTKLPPERLLQVLKQIEQYLGRRKSKKWGPREIDLDLLFFGSEVVWQSGLKIPHPEAAHRRFVLAPLAELVPSFPHPALGLTVRTLLNLAPIQKSMSGCLSSVVVRGGRRMGACRSLYL